MIGAKDHLARRDVLAAANAWRSLVRRAITPIILVVDGYDDDPRELWAIPEVAAFVRRWAERVGITSYAKAIEAPLHEHSLALLALCVASGADDPPVEIV